MRQIFKAFMATTALVSAAGIANAGPNSIFIDATSNNGSVSSLAITQDASGNGNDISAAGNGVAAFPIAGALGAVAVTQTGSGNILKGAVTVAPASGVAGNINASYTAASGKGANTHSLTIGGGSGPNPTTIGGATYTNGAASVGTNGTLSVTMNTSGATATTGNVATDNLTTGGALNYTLNVAGSGNTVTNTITGASNIKLYESITGDSNTVTTASTGSGDKTIAVSLASTGNTIDAEFGSVTGAQSSFLTADNTSKVNYVLTSNGAGTSTNLALYGVKGDVAVDSAAWIAVTQAAGAQATLSLYGAGKTMGPLGYSDPTYTGGLASDGSGSGKYAVVVSQSAGAVLNATVTANANNFTTFIKQ